MTKRVMVLVALLATPGCRQFKDAMDPGRVTRREEAARVQRENEDRANAERAARAREARQREEAADQACLEAESPQLMRLCDAREREKDRQAQREHWEREEGMREHDMELRRQSLELERREARRREIDRAFQPPPAAPSRAPVNCTSLKTGDLVTTNCY